MWRTVAPLLVPGLGRAHHHHTHTTEALAASVQRLAGDRLNGTEEEERRRRNYPPAVAREVLWSGR
jgi:hypothetical protein